MKVRLIFALAVTFLATCCANSAWAVQAVANQVEECRTLATELDIPADEVENYVAECVAAELEPQEQVSVEEYCRTWALEQQLAENEIEQFIVDCIAVESQADTTSEEQGQEQTEQLPLE